MGLVKTKYCKDSACVFIWHCLTEKSVQFNTMDYYCEILEIEDQTGKRYIASLRNSIFDIDVLRNEFEDIIFCRKTKSYMLIRKK